MNCAGFALRSCGHYRSGASQSLDQSAEFVVVAHSGERCLGIRSKPRAKLPISFGELAVLRMCCSVVLSLLVASTQWRIVLLVISVFFSSPFLTFPNSLFRCRKNDGLRGFFRGYGITTVTYGLSSGVWWQTYEHTKQFVTRGLGDEKSGELLCWFACLLLPRGFAAGFAARCATRAGLNMCFSSLQA